MAKFIAKPRDILNEIPKAVQKLDNETFYCVEIKLVKNPRTLEQNKMLWKNIDLAAKAMGKSIWDVYADLLIQTNAESEYLYVNKEMEGYLRKQFRAVQFVQTTTINNKKAWVYRVFAGSSQMTIKQCTELLDRSLDLLTKLGVNYKDLEEIR